MTRLLVQHLLYHSKCEMLRLERTKGHSKGTRAWQKIIQSLSLTFFYQFGEDNLNIMFEQILRNEKPYLLPKRLNCSKNIQCQGNVLRSGLSHKQHRVNTLSLYCCEQKLNQTNSILPFHLEEF